MATKDFSSKQIRVSQLLASGGIAGTSVGMAIYSASNASNLEGGISDSAVFNDVGSDVFLFVSGTVGGRGTEGITAFGGDLHISGNLTVEGSSPSGGNTLDEAYDQGGSGIGREINVDSGPVQINTLTGDAFLITGSTGTRLFSNISGESPVFTISNTEPGISSGSKIQLQTYYDKDNVITPSPLVPYNTSIQQTGETFVIIQHRTVGAAASRGTLAIGQLALSGDQTYAIVQTGSAVGTDDLVMILSGTTMGASDPNPVDFADTSFFVSGAIGGKDGSVRGMSVFGGDVVISGTLYPGGNTDQFISADGTEIIIDGNDHVDVRIDNSFGVYYGPAGVNPIFAVYGSSGTVVNTSGLLYQDFRVESDNKEGAILLDSQTEQLALLVDATTAATAYDGAPIPSDIDLYVSGAIGGKGTEGTSVFGGDVFVSGSLYSEQTIRAFNNINLSDNQGSATPTIYFNDDESVYIREGGNSLTIESNNNLYLVFDESLRFSADAESNPVFVCSNSPGTLGIKGSLFNHGQDSDQDFSVSTTNQKRAIFVSSSDDSVMFHAEGLPPVASDTHFFVSGSQGGKNISGTAVFAGDVVISGSLHGGSPLQIGEYQPDVGTDVVLYVSGTTPSGGGGKGTPGGTTVLNSDLVVSGTYRGGYDPTAGSESFQAISDNYLFMSSDADFGSPQIEATDSNFFFTGSIGSRGGGTPGTAVFGGDLHVSGAITADGGAPAPTYRYLYKDITNSAVQNAPNAFPFLNFRSDDGTDAYATGGVVFSMPGSGSIERIIFTPANAGQDFSVANKNTFNSGDEAVIFIAKNERLNGALYTTTNTQLPAMHCTSSDSNLVDFDFTNGNLTPATNTIKKLFLDFSNNNPFISGSNQFDPGDTIMIGAYFKSRPTTGGVAEQINVQIVFKIDETTTFL